MRRSTVLSLSLSLVFHDVTVKNRFSEKTLIQCYIFFIATDRNRNKPNMHNKTGANPIKLFTCSSQG
jgi:hypothetical protein